MGGFEKRWANRHCRVGNASQIGNLAINFMRGGHNLVAQTEIERQTMIELEIILDEKPQQRLAIVAREV